ncbi:MAG: alpha/beta fold hydrolase [Alphaproteobacteria bacterium]|jgi:polyhydroxyalkanoate synthase
MEKKDEKNQPNFSLLNQNLATFFQKGQEFIIKYLSHNQQQKESANSNLSQFYVFGKVLNKLLSDPARVMGYQIDLYQKLISIWQESVEKMSGSLEELERDKVRDRRFSNSAWKNNPYFDSLKHFYLTSADYLTKIIDEVEVDPEIKTEAKFYAKQLMEAISPSNFIFTNPEIIEKIITTNGQNLVDGMTNLIRDFELNNGVLKVSLTDPNYYKVGENLAITKGSVVFKNKLVEIINYAPTQKQVYENPIFIISPWINKYYILDLRPENSFVKWLTDKGYNVFITSWINPDETFAETSFEDYVQLGFLDVIGFLETNLGFKKINVIGYCLGGTLLACGLGVLYKRGLQAKINSSIFLTTLIDFSIPGDLGIFVNDINLTVIKNHLEQNGYFDGRVLSNVFSSLRARELFWNAITDHYLLGKDYGHFDILHWNSDSSNMPAKMHIFYLENFYKKNLLVVPDAITILGETINLEQITMPLYFLAAKEDHIVPPQGAFLGISHFGSQEKHFTLTESGHVAGIVNHPNNKKYGCFVSEKLSSNLNDWLIEATKIQQSWWEDLDKWLHTNNLLGKELEAKDLIDRTKKYYLSAAPGEYIRKRI